MAMMTARKRAVREIAWSRAKPVRASGCGAKSAGRYEPDGDLAAFANRISVGIDWTAGDTASCLARQAGPGPRM
jgi:hypothetical protein